MMRGTAPLLTAQFASANPNKRGRRQARTNRQKPKLSQGANIEDRARKESSRPQISESWASSPPPSRPRNQPPSPPQRSPPASQRPTITSTGDQPNSSLHRHPYATLASSRISKPIGSSSMAPSSSATIRPDVPIVRAELTMQSLREAQARHRQPPRADFDPELDISPGQTLTPAERRARLQVVFRQGRISQANNNIYPSLTSCKANLGTDRIMAQKRNRQPPPRLPPLPSEPQASRAYRIAKLQRAQSLPRSPMDTVTTQRRSLRRRPRITVPRGRLQVTIPQGPPRRIILRRRPISIALLRNFRMTVILERSRASGARFLLLHNIHIQRRSNARLLRSRTTSQARMMRKTRIC